MTFQCGRSKLCQIVLLQETAEKTLEYTNDLIFCSFRSRGFEPISNRINWPFRAHKFQLCLLPDWDDSQACTSKAKIMGFIFFLLIITFYF